VCAIIYIISVERLRVNFAREQMMRVENIEKSSDEYLAVVKFIEDTIDNGYDVEEYHNVTKNGTPIFYDFEDRYIIEVPKYQPNIISHKIYTTTQKPKFENVYFNGLSLVSFNDDKTKIDIQPVHHLSDDSYRIHKGKFDRIINII
jgi:hypothetical protein